jgi:catechol 2,3-dioxygenase-like lactoylglutathione lyase family enzyme
MMALHHVGITVRDLRASIEFYCKFLRCKLRSESAGTGDDLKTLTGYRDAHVAIADLDLPDGGALELLQYLAPQAAPLNQERSQPGHTHIAFVTSDVDEIYRRFVEHGIPATSPPVTIEDPGTVWDGARAFYATDPDGRTIEFVTMRSLAGRGMISQSRETGAEE